MASTRTARRAAWLTPRHRATIPAARHWPGHAAVAALAMGAAGLLSGAGLLLAVPSVAADDVPEAIAGNIPEAIAGDVPADTPPGTAIPVAPATDATPGTVPDPLLDTPLVPPAAGDQSSDNRLPAGNGQPPSNLPPLATFLNSSALNGSAPASAAGLVTAKPVAPAAGVIATSP